MRNAVRLGSQIGHRVLITFTYGMTAIANDGILHTQKTIVHYVSQSGLTSMRTAHFVVIHVRGTERIMIVIINIL